MQHVREYYVALANKLLDKESAKKTRASAAAAIFDLLRDRILLASALLYKTTSMQNKKEDNVYTYKAEVLRVIDGDSVWLRVDVGFCMYYKANFRLLGIDAPELRSKDPDLKKKAYASKERLEELLPAGSTVTIETKKTGKYGRWLATIFAKGENVNDIMVQENLAKVYGS